MDKLFDEYSRKARLAPALLCIFPFLVIKHYAIDPYLGISWWTQIAALVVEDLSLALVLIYLLSQVNRFLSKVFFENKKKFPTDEALLPSSKELSPDLRARLEAKINGDFQLTLPTPKDEEADLAGTKTRIREIVSLILHKVKDGRLLLKHNIDYGFARNLVGGSLLAFSLSIGAAILFHFLHNQLAYVISLGLALFYLIPLLFSKLILKHYGNEYASILFREYLGG